MGIQEAAVAKALAKPVDKRSWIDRVNLRNAHLRVDATHESILAANPTLVREYADLKLMAHDVATLTAQGYHVVSQSSYTPRKGLGRTVAGGLLFFNRKPVTVVTYTR